jgi:hypothetical protein
MRVGVRGVFFDYFLDKKKVMKAVGRHNALCIGVPAA